jgi:cytochrome P450
MDQLAGQARDAGMFDIEEDAKRAGAGVVTDPYPQWAELLAKAPVHEGAIAELMGLTPGQGNMYKPGLRYFTAFSFAAVSDVFTRKDDFDSAFYHDLGGALFDSILGMDGPVHRRFRNLIQEHFQPAAAESWWRKKIVDGLVEEMVGEFEKSDGVDLNSMLFARLPWRTVTAGFGLPETEGLVFRRHIQSTSDMALTSGQRTQANIAADEILYRAIALRRAEPQDDLISRLILAELKEDDGTRPLTDAEIIGFCRLIVFAGGGTTWKQLGITLFALLNNRDQLEAVMADRSLLPNAILESARWYPNDPVFPRKAKRDTVLQGVEIPKDAVLHLCLGAANRDPVRWENPEEYDLHRKIQRSVAFGAGAHSCLGQHVAREEMLAALNVLFDRFPKIRWDSSQPPAFLTGGMLSRGPGPLYVLLR